MSKLLALSPYILAIATIAIGIFDLVKDWPETKASWLKRSKAGALCLAGVLTIVSVRLDEKDKAEQKAAAQKLEGQAEAANKAQSENTVLYLNTYKDLSGQVSDLKTQVTTDALQKKLDRVQIELQNTQKAMAPSPKSQLQFTFDPPSFGSDGKAVPVTETFLPADADGNLHIVFDILNSTDVDAIDGEITLIICDACKFAKEPDQSRKLPTEPDSQRNFPFARILAQTRVAEIADIIVPANGGSVQIGMTFRCTTCILPSGIVRATIYQQRGFLKSYPASR